MSTQQTVDGPRVVHPDGLRWSRVLVPTDLGPLSDLATRHGLRLALGGPGQLTLVHVGPEGEVPPWSAFPSFRGVAASWGLCRAEGARTDIDDLGVRTTIVRVDSDAPLPAILHEVHQLRPDLLVVGNHRHGGLAHWVGHLVSEPLARRSGRPTLFLPEGCRPLVQPQTGAIHLHRVLIPIHEHPDPVLGIAGAARTLRTLGVKDAVLFLLHLDERGDLPHVPLPRDPGWDWRGKVIAGDVVPEVLRIAEQWPADLVVMGTLGHDHMSDDLFGSRTEQVLRAAPCPVLSVPSPTAS